MHQATRLVFENKPWTGNADNARGANNNSNQRTPGNDRGHGENRIPEGYRSRTGEVTRRQTLGSIQPGSSR